MSGAFHGLLASLAGSVRDTFFKYVSLLLPGNGTNLTQNNTFIDSSINTFTITRNGNTTQGTFSPFGSNWSNFFDGSGDYLTIPDNQAFTLSNSEWTIEAWFFLSSTSGYQCIGGQGDSTGDQRSFLLYATEGTGKPMMSIQYNGGTTLNLTSSTAASANTWNHVAVVRNGNTMTLYLNGSDVGSSNVTGVTIDNSAQSMTIGRSGDFNGEYINGYISNFRIVNGAPVYTSNFIPSTTPLTAISNTSLLACQSNRFLDNSTNNFTITPNGDASVQRFSPFDITGAYNSTTTGGSGYFDGAGDYLSIADSVDLELGSGNWTIEGWFYVTTGTSTRTIYCRDNNIDADVLIRFNGFSKNLEVYLSSDGINFGIASTSAISGAPIHYNSWNHFAVTSSGGTIRKGINGVMDSIGTLSSIVNSTKTWYVGVRGDISQLFSGYISGLRVVVGTALYTAATYTIPTTPLTAITNTRLLLNFTNAGIIDNSMMNDLETVGTVEIRTAISKFGGSSIYFNGASGYLTMPASPQFGFSTGNFTIEAWIYPTGFGGSNSVIIDFRSGVEPSVKPDLELSSTGDIIYRVNGSTVITGSTLSVNTWYHIALCRASGTTRLFVNGTQVGSNYTDNNNYGNSARCWVGADDDGVPNAYYGGYIDDLRITKGVARYTGNFTTPNAPFPLS